MILKMFLIFRSNIHYSRMKKLGNRVLRRIFGPKRDGMVGGWRTLHNEKLHNFYNSPSIITMIKSKRLRWTGHVA
jgi:hypothetical protein